MFLRDVHNMAKVSYVDDSFNPLTDEAMELIDPTPDIHTLFVQFNARFFQHKLGAVQVKWSNRMTSSAGICRFRGRNKECVITLSAPLLKLRPRKDLVETLLHEMIHAYLFLTNNDRDRDGHGPTFCMHMHKINKEAGTNITIYHNFHDEVRLYQQHMWKCDGPCQYRPPYFGILCRSMNRAPGPSDRWWADHQSSCGGKFIKKKEPNNYKSKKNCTSNSKNIDKSKLNRSITDWVTPITNIPKSRTAPTFMTFNQSNNDIDKPSTSKGRTDPAIRTKSINTTNIASKSSTFSSSGVLGGSRTGQSNLLKKFQHLANSSRLSCLPHQSTSAAPSESPPIVNESANNSSSSPQRTEMCPECNVPLHIDNIFEHVDTCMMYNSTLIDEINNNLDNNNGSATILNRLTKRVSIEDETETEIETAETSKRIRLDESSNVERVSCPVCNNMIPATDINQHLDECLEKNNGPSEMNISSHAVDNDTTISINSSYNSDLDHSIECSSSQPSTSASATKSDTALRNCLICNATLAAEESLNDHLEECIGNMFNDVIVINDDGNDDDAVSEKDDLESKYPCPVCMQVMPENLMNQHLNTCLKDE